MFIEGAIVESTAGRDKGKHFIVLEVVNEKFVIVVDGVLRTISNPKMKNVKHLKDHMVIAEGLAEKIKENKQIFDKEICKVINEYLQKKTIKSGGDTFCQKKM